MARADDGAREGEGVTVQGERKSAAEVDFSNSEQGWTWFQSQPREVCMALAMRSALRVLPQIEARRDISDFAPRIALPVLRACFVACTVAEYPSQRDCKGNSFSSALASRQVG